MSKNDTTMPAIPDAQSIVAMMGWREVDLGDVGHDTESASARMMQAVYLALYRHLSQRIRSAASEVDQPKCYKCGLPMIRNPHPDAGQTSRMLEVGCPLECLPCTVLSRHQWATRAYAAEKKLLEASEAGAVAYRYRHSETEKWHYGEHPQNWWECQALTLAAPPSAPAAEPVPLIPTPAMLDAARDWSAIKYGKPIGDDAATGCWLSMLKAAQRVTASNAVPWANFPAYLIDHCEGDTITEEGLQFALAKMLADPKYAAPAAESAEPSKKPPYQPHQTGVGEWCAPGPAAEQRRYWFVRFEDADRDDLSFTDERKAREAFASFEARGWNCHLFGQLPRSRPTAATADAQGDERPQVPANVIAAIQAYGDARADGAATGAFKIGETVEALRAWGTALSRQPSAPASAPEALHPDSGHHERYIAGWNACRAALSAPASAHVGFYEREFYPMSNFSSFRLRWKDHDFDTSEHAYHWEKFRHQVEGESDNDRFQRNSLAENIRRSRSAHEAFKLAELWKHMRRPDWDAVKVDIMRGIVRAKADQHEYVRRKLLQTGDRMLVEDSWRDDFWGWGPKRDGQNVLGKLWMEVRAVLAAAKPEGADRE